MKTNKMNLRMIILLAKDDFKRRYAGSFMGIAWGFIHPLVQILIYWVVFEFGLKSGGMNEYPFFLWLVSGIVPYFFFAEVLNSATMVYYEYNYLVKKISFDISVLPIIKGITAYVVHLFFIFLIVIFSVIYGYSPDLFILQIIYYSIAMFTYSIVLSYITSAIVLFAKDFKEIVSIIVQFLMWLTPIIWNQSIVPDKFKYLFNLNPIYYIVEGFRDSVLYKTWFWEKMDTTIYFWIHVILLYAISKFIVKRLKPHFADVL